MNLFVQEVGTPKLLFLNVTIFQYLPLSEMDAQEVICDVRGFPTL